MPLKKKARGPAARFRSMSYITPFTHPHCEGYAVRIKRVGVHGSFPALRHGGKAAALVAAQEFRDQAYVDHPELLRDSIQQHVYKKSKLNKTDTPGVNLSERRNHSNTGWLYYYTATWRDPVTKQPCKAVFACKKYGKQKAKELATEARDKAVAMIKAYYR